MNTMTFRITNLTCDACVKVCTMLISRVAGVTAVTIDFTTGKSAVTSTIPIDLDIIRKRLDEKNYQVTTN